MLLIASRVCVCVGGLRAPPLAHIHLIDGAIIKPISGAVIVSCIASTISLRMHDARSRLMEEGKCFSMESGDSEGAVERVCLVIHY